MTENPLNRRVITDTDKRAIIERLYALWIAHPELRLGQLILNPFHNNENFYYTEDQDFITYLEQRYQQWDQA